MIICLHLPRTLNTITLFLYTSTVLWIRLGRKGVNFGDSLTTSGVCYMGSKDEDGVKYFGKIICLPLPNLV